MVAVAAMTDAAVSEALRLFLRDHIACYEELHLLLFLRERGAVWCELTSIGEHLAASAEALRGSLHHLAEVDLIEARHVAPASKQYRYAPATSAACAMVDELAALCADQPLALVKVMTSNALERLRDRSLTTFDRVLSARGGKRRPPH